VRSLLPIVKKAFRQIIRDPRTLGVLLFIPIFLLLMFGYTISLDVKHIRLAVLDYSHTADSRELVQRFTATEYFDAAGYLTDLDQAALVLEREEAQCVLVIPRNYQRDLKRGATAQLQILVDGTNSNVGATAMGYVLRVVENISLQLLQRGGQSFPGGVDFRPRVWFNPELRSPVYLIPGLISLILVVTAVISTAMSIVREKEHGTMEQLVVAPIHPLQLIVGKTIPYTVMSLMIALMVLLAGSTVFHISIQGSPTLLLLVTFLFLLSCLGLGILISTIADSQQVAFMISTIVTMLPTFILSGFIFPIRNMPVFVQILTYIIPARYYLEALRGIMLKGAGIGHFVDEIVAMLIFTTVTIGISALRMKPAILILESALALSKMRMPPTVRNTNHCYANEANSQFGSH